ncbi:hypothetical protein [Streptomyces sp. BRA346]|uniref:hypothetical protein n=1 Tax=Streptomyces sp. BRA346 TaxID=2878199 RepID=UPI004064C71D
MTPASLLGPGTDLVFVDALVGPLDRRVPGIVTDWTDGRYATAQHRLLAADAKALLTALACPRSRWHRDVETLLGPAQGLISQLTTLQGDDGLFGGDNLASPPDSSFTVGDVCVMTELIDTTGVRDLPQMGELYAALAGIRRAVTPALLTGGVHTPNHRWELCAALARLHRIEPDPRLPARIGQWLAEGIDIYPDGMYSERSPLYAAFVTNPSLLVIADVLARPELEEKVRRNLDAFAPLFDEDGTVESVHSRRQDQRMRFDGAGFLLQFRRLALRDSRGDHARLVTDILARGVDGEIAGHALAEVLLDPRLAGPLPSAGPGRPAVGQTVLADSGLARVRAGRRGVTVFGGSDNARFPRIASGLSTNPTFLRFRQGNAVLESLRLSVAFFGLGPFRSEGLYVRGEGRYALTQTTQAHFYQPLPAYRHRADGRYELGDEGRFFASMDFPHRPTDDHQLRIDADVDVTESGVDVRLDLRAIPTSYVLELVFRPGGTLKGVRPLSDPDSYELVEGTGSYTVGGDTIRFGPGNGSGPAQPTVFDDGEQFSYLGARDPVPGTRVCITGRVPSTYTLSLIGTQP